MVVEWSTDSIAPARRFQEWREACCQQVYALTPERQEQHPFSGRLRHHRAGPLDVVDVHCDGHLVQRRPQDIRQQPSSTCYVYRQLEGTAWFEQRGRHLVAQAGDIVIADPNLVFSTGAQGSFDFRLWRLERARIEPMLAVRTGELPMIKLDRQSAEAALIHGWLDALLHNYAGMQSHSLDLAVGTLCTLVADAAGLSPEMRERGRESRRAAQLLRVQRWLELHCTDADLNAETVAGEFAMSLRALHQLFEPSGTSFHEQLTDARLRKAHALLLDASQTHLSTVAIGFAAGFRETSTFYRRFRLRYGVTPGEMRGD
jgi:transcriptional regulator GlxA family with amidase domain